MAQKQSQIDVKSTNFLSIFRSLLEVACQYLIREKFFAAAEKYYIVERSEKMASSFATSFNY